MGIKLAALIMIACFGILAMANHYSKQGNGKAFDVVDFYKDLHTVTYCTHEIGNRTYVYNGVPCNSKGCYNYPKKITAKTIK